MENDQYNTQSNKGVSGFFEIQYGFGSKVSIRREARKAENTTLYKVQETSNHCIPSLMVSVSRKGLFPLKKVK